MNKFNYSAFNPDNTDIVFSTDNSYGDPASETETRKQLSYPLKEVKTYLNNLIPTDSNDNPVQLVVTSTGMKYRTETGGTAQTVPVPSSLPTGGSTSQLLGKVSNDDLDVGWTDSLPILTTAPVADNPNGVKLVYLETAPATKYSGYIYLIKG